LHIAVTKATGYINKENIGIHNYAMIQHMLKYKKYRYTIQIEIYIVISFVGNDGESESLVFF